MAQVSQNPLDKKTETDLLSAFHLILSHISNPQDMQSFLLSFLSPTEKLMLAKRLAIVILLDQGQSDTEIAITLSTTRATVAKLRYFVESRGKGYEIAFKILRDEKINAEIKKVLRALGGYAARAAGGRVKPTIL